MSAVTVATTILNAVKVDAAVVAYLAANFPVGAQSLDLFLGLDVQSLPDESSPQWAAIIPQSVGLADTADHEVFSFAFTITIKSTTKTAQTYFTEFAGVALIEGLADVVQTAVNTAVSLNVMNLSSISFDTNFPYFRASWDFIVPNTI